jgi:hypothetical protein
MRDMKDDDDDDDDDQEGIVKGVSRYKLPNDVNIESAVDDDLHSDDIESVAITIHSYHHPPINPSTVTIHGNLRLLRPL